MHSLPSRNAYRVLGLSGNATRAEVLSAAKRLRLRLQAGVVRDQPDPFTPFYVFDAPSVQEIDAAVRALEKPASRLTHRLLRFSIAGPHDQEAWDALANDEDPGHAREIWEASWHGAGSQLNHARLLWFLCDQDTYPFYLPWWRALFAYWGSAAQMPAFRSEIVPAEIEATFEFPASANDYRHVIDQIPVLLTQVCLQASMELAESEDEEACAQFLDLLDESELAPATREQIYGAISSAFLARAEEAVEEFESSDLVEASDSVGEVILRLRLCRNMRAAESVAYQNLRRRAGKRAREFAIQFERLGNIEGALEFVQRAEKLLEGTPDAALLAIDLQRIRTSIESAKKAKDTLQTNVEPTKTTKVSVPPAVQPVITQVSAPAFCPKPRGWLIVREYWDWFIDTTRAPARLLCWVVWIGLFGTAIQDDVFFLVCLASLVAAVVLFAYLIDRYAFIANLFDFPQSILILSSLALILAVPASSIYVEKDRLARQHAQEQELAKMADVFEQQRAYLMRTAVKAKKAWMRYRLVRALEKEGFPEYADEVTDAYWDMRSDMDHVQTIAQSIAEDMEEYNRDLDRHSFTGKVPKPYSLDLTAEHRSLAFVVWWTRRMNSEHFEEAVSLRIASEKAANGAIYDEYPIGIQNYAMPPTEVSKLIKERFPWKN